MSTPLRSVRPATASINPSIQRRFAVIVEDDPVDVRCFMCMAACIQTWACFSNEGRARVFCTETCMKSYLVTNITPLQSKKIAERSDTPPAVRRSPNIKIPENTGTPNSHIDLSKRVLHIPSVTPSSTPPNKSPSRTRGNS